MLVEISINHTGCVAEGGGTIFQKNITFSKSVKNVTKRHKKFFKGSTQIV